MSRPVRLPFTVAHCGSEDDAHLASELLQPGPGCKGWRSAQYCIFPQELVLQLECRATVTRLQFLMHNTMIPTSMEVMVGDLASKDPVGTSEAGGGGVDLRKALFASLGNLDWSDNRETNFGGRQLQTVELEGGGGANRGLFVKIVLRRNHINRENEYNQVCLMGVNVFGYPASSSSDGADDSASRSAAKKAHRDDLAFLMYTDPDVVEIINQLEDRRARALDDGREEYARKLRRAVKDLDEAGQELGVQVAMKRGAIDRKDFAEAKVLKEKIEERREAIYRDHNVSELLELTGQRVAANDERGGGGRESGLAELPPAVRHKTKPRSPSPRDDRPPRQPTPIRRTPSPLPPTSTSRREVRSATPPRFRASAAAPPPPPRSPPRRRRDSYPPPSSQNKSSRSKIKPDEGDGGELNMTDKDRKELSAALEVYGTPVLRRALHKTPQQKEEALAEVRRRLENYRSPEEGGDPDLKPGRMMRATSQILARLERAPVWAVFNKAVETHIYVFTHFVETQKVARKELESGVLRLYAELIVRAGDTNERVSDRAEDGIEAMLACKKVQDVHVLQEELIQPLTTGAAATGSKKGKSEPPKQALTRCEMVLHMIERLLLAGRQPTTIGRLLKFGTSAASHSSPPCRKQGEKILLALHSLDPDRARDAVEDAAAADRATKAQFKKILDEFDRREDQQR